MQQEMFDITVIILCYIIRYILTHGQASVYLCT